MTGEEQGQGQHYEGSEQGTLHAGEQASAEATARRAALEVAATAAVKQGQGRHYEDSEQGEFPAARRRSCELHWSGGGGWQALAGLLHGFEKGSCS